MRARSVLMLLVAALLGGCVIAPYPVYGPRYAYYHPYPHYWWR